jgi:hypothetical protein
MSPQAQPRKPATILISGCNRLLGAPKKKGSALASWSLKPQKVVMPPDQYRIAVILALIAAGATPEEAQIEADRRLAAMTLREQ